MLSSVTILLNPPLHTKNTVSLTNLITSFCSAMGLKTCLAAFFLLFLLLVTPCVSRGLKKKDPEIYEIDYRGPETHSYRPPPNRFDGRHNIHHQNVAVHRKSKDNRVPKPGKKGKKIHG